MELDKRNQKIIEYWIHNVLSSDFIIDLIMMIVEFAKLHEKFDEKLSHKDLIIENDGLSGRCNTEFQWKYSLRTLVGMCVAEPGGKYVWKIKLTQGNHIGIGIVLNEEAENGLKEYWWGHKQGYIWYAKDQGTPNFAPGSIEYGCDAYENDKITMCFDLSKYEISYMINDKSLGVVNTKIDEDTKYRFAVGFFGENVSNAVQILSLDVYQY